MIPPNNSASISLEQHNNTSNLYEQMHKLYQYQLAQMSAVSMPDMNNMYNPWSQQLLYNFQPYKQTMNVTQPHSVITKTSVVVEQPNSNQADDSDE